MTEARDLSFALGGRWFGNYGTAPCPVCQTERRQDQNALTIADGNHGLLAHCKKSNCAFHQIMAATGSFSGASVDVNDRKARREADHEAHSTFKSWHAQRIWNQTRPIGGSPAETYLRSRGIKGTLPKTLRFHPNCWHGPASARFPAMIAKIEGSEGFSVHRTFLQSDGSDKAIVDGPNKMMLGPVAGGAVHLESEPGSLVVAEGIETALSLRCGLVKRPASIWATLSTAGLRTLTLPQPAGRLVIASDGDNPGRLAAETLAQRAFALGWHVSLLPAPEGRDWNDVLNAEGDTN